MCLENSISILIPLYNSKEMASRCIKSAIKFKKNHPDYKVHIIISDDSPDKSVELFLKSIDIFKNNCTFLSRDSKASEINPAVNNWNFLLNYSFNFYPNSYYMLLHHDEAIASNVRFKFKNNSRLYICSLRGKVSRRNSFIGRLLSRLFLIIFPELLYSFNTIGPSACFISNKKIFFNTELTWLVDVDFYYRTIISLNKRSDIIFDNQCSIETFVNDTSITSTLDISKILTKERQLLNLSKPNSLIINLLIKYKQLASSKLKA
tara:strand:- start:97 stop:885 length:789 start_codon:yes stop_codon:yes gene_type:complete